MNKYQYRVVKNSFNNFFNLTAGQVFTNVDIHNPLEDILFEDLQEWHTQKIVESRLIAVLEKNFKGLVFDQKSLKFKADMKEAVLRVSIKARLKEDSNEEFEEFIFTAKKG
jgi:hypothetical protein